MGATTYVLKGLFSIHNALNVARGYMKNSVREDYFLPNAMS